MHVALLRGINVGGRNVIPMRELVRAFEETGFTNVSTYIQSGNVLFDAGGGTIQEITTRIERELTKRFDYAARVMVKSKRQYLAAVAAAPDDWGHDATSKHNALFLRSGVPAASILAQLPPLRDGLERTTCGPGVIFWSAAAKDVAKTTMMKLGSHRAFHDVTVRNHKTTWKLRELLTR